MRMFDMKEYILRHYQKVYSEWKNKILRQMDDAEIEKLYTALKNKEKNNDKR